MKKVLVLLALALGLNVSASHLLGGYIQTVQRGYSDTVDITVILFTDPQGIANPTTISLQEFKLVNNFYQSNATFTVTQQSATTWQGVNAYVYTGVRVISAGDYRFIYTNCCRGMLTNASSAMNSNFTIALDYKKTAQGTAPNSAPIIVNPLPIKWVVGDTAQSILFAVDPDGDSVMVEKDDAINQHANNVFVPLAPFSQLGNYGLYYVDVNGTIIWSPSTAGTFGTGYKITEFRNGSVIGINRIQQVYSTVVGSTPSIPWPFVQVNHDLVNGDSTEIFIQSNNATTTQLYIPGVDVIKTSDSTWSLVNLQVGNYRAVSRVTNGSSNMDYQFNFQVRSTIGIEEHIADYNMQYQVYDWYGRYMGSNINWAELKGLYVIRYSNGTAEKVFIQ